jgi:hypothetical protein
MRRLDFADFRTQEALRLAKMAPSSFDPDKLMALWYALIVVRLDVECGKRAS